MTDARKLASNGSGAEDGAQAAVIEFLSRPGTYPDAAGGVSSIATHAAIVFLASDEAAYITGHVLDVNGGLYLA